MKNWIIVENDIVINLIIADTKEIAQEVSGKEAIGDNGYICIGWDRKSGEWKSPQPYNSWIWDSNLKNWEPPTPKPFGLNFEWNEELLMWEEPTE